MTFQEFITRYDIPGAIVLLEGKRNVQEADQDKLVAIGKLLVEKTRFVLFRSGNAPGADQYFSEGVSAVDQKRLQVIVPYSGHRKRKNVSYDTISLDDVPLANEPEVVYHSRSNRKTEKLIDEYLSGNRDRFAMKAAYILRDTVKVLGTSEIPRASLALFYDDLENPEQGGTGHTIRTCRKNGVPAIDQRVWFKWLDEE